MHKDRIEAQISAPQNGYYSFSDGGFTQDGRPTWNVQYNTPEEPIYLQSERRESDLNEPLSRKEIAQLPDYLLVQIYSRRQELRNLWENRVRLPETDRFFEDWALSDEERADLVEELSTAEVLATRAVAVARDKIMEGGHNALKSFAPFTPCPKKCEREHAKINKPD